MKLKIDDVSFEGMGVSHDLSKVVFVPNTLEGEEIEAHIVKEEKRYCVYELDKVIKASNRRVTNLCPYKNCGGCRYLHTDYANSLDIKKKNITELFKKNGFDVPINIVENKQSLGYRNKIELKIKDKQIGYYKEETHEFIPIKKCLLVKDSINNFLSEIDRLKIKDGSITIRANFNDILLVKINTLDDISLDQEYFQKYKVCGVVLNDKVVYNDDFFIEKSKYLYKVNVDSFFQVNSFISAQIQEDILKYFSSKDVVFDLYCGVGFFSIPLAYKTSKVLGIEYSKSSILNALYNAKLNKVDNVYFNAGKVEDIINNVDIKPNKVIVDPPRSGLNKNVCKTLNKLKCDLIIYISCNPLTLVRDLKLLDNYDVKKVTLYDMFSYTKHIESVVILEKIK